MNAGKRRRTENATEVAMQLFLATGHGFAAYEGAGEHWQALRHGLESHHVTCISRQGDLLLAGTHSGIFRSTDRGRNWKQPRREPEVSHLRWLLCHPERNGLALAGTEPAAIFYTEDGGQTWTECPEVAELRDRGGWYLPYSPRAGCVRGFAVHGPRAYAAVEQGGMLYSTDYGKSWQLVGGSAGDTTHRPPPALHPDVHSVTVHGSSRDLVFAPTGGGFYRSRDGGETWDLLYNCYCRAVWVDPEDPSHMVLGPADGVSSNGRIEVTQDAGRTWQRASAGLDVPWPDRMVDRFVRAGDHLFALLSDGRMLASPVDELSWRTVLPDVHSAEAMVNA